MAGSLLLLLHHALDLIPQRKHSASPRFMGGLLLCGGGSRGRHTTCSTCSFDASPGGGSRGQHATRSTSSPDASPKKELLITNLKAKRSLDQLSVELLGLLSWDFGGSILKRC